eukprot:TRINITY_DN22560_c0_g1_i1.p1 TRINITY_DN22560_c0_g1~~TRINITY_DN22560_c0_g1_i1.p1  ORF type:complete len:431 (+),score=91.17 TRINITY_DN22560_c0_g1_i1:144-1436(+)
MASMAASTAVLSILLASFVAIKAVPSDSILVQILGSRYTSVVGLLEQADLLTYLEGEERFEDGVTIFVPSDHYLNDVASPVLLAFLQLPRNGALLRKVLLHHMLRGKLEGRAWYPGRVAKALSGGDVSLLVEGTRLNVDRAVVTDLNVLEADDGVVHEISGLLLPEEVEEAFQLYLQEAADVALPQEEQFVRRELAEAAGPVQAPVQAPAPAPAAVASPALAALDAALQDKGYTTLLALIGSDPAFTTALGDELKVSNITLLAPDNAALAGVNQSALTTAELTQILEYHVIIGNFDYAALQAAGARRRLLSLSLTTLEGSPVTVTSNASGVYLNGALLNDPTLLPQTSNSQTGSSQTGNLVGYGINELLIPPTTTANTTAVPPPPPPPPPKSGSAGRPSALLWSPAGSLTFLAAAAASLLLLGGGKATSF